MSRARGSGKSTGTISWILLAARLHGPIRRDHRRPAQRAKQLRRNVDNILPFIDDRTRDIGRSGIVGALRLAARPSRKNEAEPGSRQTDALFRGYNYVNAARTNLVFALGIG